VSAQCKRILLADDDLAVLSLQETFLSRPGIEIRQARSGNEAIRHILAGFMPDVVVSDLNMPDGSGLDLLRFVRHHESTLETPILILSGSSCQEEIDRARAMGCTVFLRKPISLSLLEAEIALCMALPVRSGERTRTRLPALLHGSAGELPVWVRDVGASGLFLESTAPLDVGRGYRLELLHGSSVELNGAFTQVSLVRESTRQEGGGTVYGYGATIQFASGRRDELERSF